MLAFISSKFIIEAVPLPLDLWFYDYFDLFYFNIEDDIREKERNKEFDSEFIELARSVYFTNDERAEIKKRINLKYGSYFVEEKSYEKY